MLAIQMVKDDVMTSRVLVGLIEQSRRIVWPCIPKNEPVGDSREELFPEKTTPHPSIASTGLVNCAKSPRRACFKAVAK